MIAINCCFRQFHALADIRARTLVGRVDGRLRMALITRKPNSLLLVSLIPILAACSDMNSPGDSVIATYTLRSVNGKPLPTTVHADTGSRQTVFKIDMLSRALRLQADAAFSISTVSTTSDGPSSTTATSEEHGTLSYGVSDGSLRLTEDGRSVRGTLLGDTITLAEPAGEFVYIGRRPR